MDHWMSLAVVAVLLVISALVSGSEVAFFSLSPQTLSDLEEEESSSSGLFDHCPNHQSKHDSVFVTFVFELECSVISILYRGKVSAVKTDDDYVRLFLSDEVTPFPCAFWCREIPT